MSKNSTSGSKQVIVMRNDLNMRKGKMVAQGSHASCMALADPLLQLSQCRTFEDVQTIIRQCHGIFRWVLKGMTKITVRVDSENELMDIADKAEAASLTVHVVTDAGHTEFNGVPTKTCLCIGPNNIEKIDAITGGLKLL